MGDEDHGGVDRAQRLLEPLERLDVEVVGRLVEQEQVGLRRQCARERRARELATREGVKRPVEIVLVEAEAAHDRGCPVAPVVPARMLEPRLRLRVAPQGRRVVRARGHRSLELPQLPLDGGEVGGAGERVVAQRHPAERRRPLVVKCDARALLERELAALERCFACDRTEQGCLAGTVGAGEREAVAALELERDAVEERLAGELLAQG